jgi:tRNA (cmo5U34)-methyltransferase
MTSPEHDHPAAHHLDAHVDWNDEQFVAQWLDRQQGRLDRPRQFAVIRAVIPHLPTQEFRYLNLGAGPGILDEMLLTHFVAAEATLVDQSLPMIAAATDRLERFGDRVDFVHADLASGDWTSTVGSDPYDVVVSSFATHLFGDALRIRELYREVFRLLGHGGVFLHLDDVRPARSSLASLSAFAALDPDAMVSSSGDQSDAPGSLLEHLGWLAEAGFHDVDVLWKNLDTTLVCGVRDHLHVPEVEGHDGARGHDGGHSHH